MTVKTDISTKEVVLILQIGSLGDTVVSIPCYREIARRHPAASLYLLTNYPIGSKMVQAEAILLPTGLIVGSIEYPMPLRKLRQIMCLRKQIRVLNPTILYYLLPERKIYNIIRHLVFFWACGLRRFSGVPWKHDLREPRATAPGERWESEACRLLRSIGVVRQAPDDSDRDLALTSAECAKASTVWEDDAAPAEFIAISVGGKVPVNDWGDENWQQVLHSLSSRRPSLGAVFIGSADEVARNERLSAAWHGPKINTCGKLTPRETAAVIARCAVFVGHDTGTLHLAGAVDTPVVGIFSARNRPGVWFSDRPRDRFFYNHVSCAGCRLVDKGSCRNGLICMASHDHAEIVATIEGKLRTLVEG